MAQGMDASAGAAGAQPDSAMALTKLQMDAIASIFKDIDTMAAAVSIKVNCNS